MDFDEFRSYMASGRPTGENPEMFPMLNDLNDRARRIMGELNTGYHPMDEIRTLFSKLIDREVDPLFRLFPPFYTDCGSTQGSGGTSSSTPDAASRTRAA